MNAKRLHALLSIGLEKDELPLISLAIPPEAADNPGIGWALGQIAKIMNGEPRPKFKLPTLPIYPACRIFDCIKGDDDHFGSYVVRKDIDIEVVVEVKSWTAPDESSNDPGGPIFGNAWTLTGERVNLEPEEAERLAGEWRGMMEEREAIENAHAAEY